VVVTLGEAGALLVPADDGPLLLQHPPPVPAVDTTGAGDCFCGALAHALAAGSGMPDAVRFAVTAASLSITGPGARTALPDETAVERLLGATPPAASGDRWLSGWPRGHEEGSGAPEEDPR
jgi:ribokinase